MTKLIGIGMSTVNHATLDSSGYWTVISTITETHEFDNGTMKEETISSKCMDRSYELALQTALATALISYREETLDRHEKNLISAREKYGRPNDTGNNHSDTITQ